MAKMAKMAKVRLTTILCLVMVWLCLPLSMAQADGSMAGSFTIEGETNPPETIFLSVIDRTVSSITLSWIAPGDDGNIGTATSYDIRYSMLTIDTDATWQAATPASNPPVPQPAGSPETFTVTDLNEGTLYFFAIKATDDQANTSGLSNSAHGQTLRGGGGGGGGSVGDAPCIITVDLMDEVTKAEISSSERTLLNSYLLFDSKMGVTLGLDADTKIICNDARVPAVLEVRPHEGSLPIPEGIATVSPIYDLTAYVYEKGIKEPRPVTFDPPIRITLNYDPEALPANASAVFVAYYDEEEGWIQLEPPSGFVAEIGKAAAQVNHFSQFAVMADIAAPPAPAQFELHNLNISPIQVKPGESVTISAEITNTGGLTGEHTIIAHIAGLLETSQMIRLTPGQTQAINFTVVPSSARSYRVEIDDLQGTFLAEAPPSPPPSVPELPKFKWWWLIIVVFTATGVVTWLLISRRKRLKLAGEAPEVSAPVEMPPTTVGGIFTLSSLNITPERVKPGEDVTVITEATNTGSTTSSYSLVLKVKGMVEAVKEIVLDPKQSQKVAFTIIKDKPGVYDIDLEGSKGKFTVA